MLDSEAAVSQHRRDGGTAADQGGTFWHKVNESEVNETEVRRVTPVKYPPGQDNDQQLV